VDSAHCIEEESPVLVTDTFCVLNSLFRLLFDRYPTLKTSLFQYHCSSTRGILDSDDEPTEKREKTPQSSASTEADFTAELQSNEFHRITQEELDDLIRDLDLPKCNAELLGSRLQQWKLLKENVRISVYCKRYKDLVQFFKMERDLVACTDIDGLMQTIYINHIPLDWRLYIHLSKLSLKAVLLHSDNTLPSIPAGHTVHNKE